MMLNALGCHKISEDEDWWGELKCVSLAFELTQQAKEGLEVVGTLRFVVYLRIISSFSFGPKFNCAFRSLQACIILPWTLWLSLAVFHYATWLSPSSPIPWTLCIFLCLYVQKTSLGQMGVQVVVTIYHGQQICFVVLVRFKELNPLVAYTFPKHPHRASRILLS